MTSEVSTSHPSVREQATHWFTRMQSGDATPQEHQACKAWRQADPAHEQAYANVAFFWQASRHLPEDEMRRILAQPDDADAAPAPSRPRATHKRSVRRQLAWGLAGAGMLAAFAVVVGPVWKHAPAQYQRTLATHAGERQEAVLPDGSRLTLNVNTRLQVALYEDRREVRLLEGEAFFSVAPDAVRAFVVLADPATVEVTGTRFNVRRDGQQVSVGVESGSVDVSSGPWWRAQTRRLTAGQALRSRDDGALDQTVAVSMENLTAWREGKMVFDDAPLAAVVRELNRYLPQPARLEAPGLNDYRVAGVFNIDEPDALLAALPAIAPVRVLRQKNGQMLILPR